MLLNRIEYALMNNPVRTAVQRHYEARRLKYLGGALNGGAALEVGCGRGVGVELVLEVFGARSVDAFDLDPRMVKRAHGRLRTRGDRIRLWVGDASAIAVKSATYDAVFDFGIVHHVPQWRGAIAEVARVLKPGGRFYAEEVLERFVLHPVTRRLLRHPEVDRFDSATFIGAMDDVGLTLVAHTELWGGFAWFVAERRGHL